MRRTHPQTFPRWRTVPPGGCELWMTPLGWPRLPPPLPRKRSGRREKNSVIKLWVMSGSHGWHPLSFPLPHYATAFTVSFSFFFSIALILFALALFTSLHPSTPQVISLSLFCYFASSFSTPPHSTVRFCLLPLSCSAFFTPPSIAFSAPPLPCPHTHNGVLLSPRFSISQIFRAGLPSALLSKIRNDNFTIVSNKPAT